MRKMKIIRIINAFLFLTIATNIDSAKPWKGIVPLVSSRADVERLLGKPRDPEQPRYSYPDEIVTVEYSRCACDRAPAVKGWPTLSVLWNVKPDLVTAIGIDLRKPVLLSSLGLNLSTFKRVPEFHLQNVFRYKNEEEGFVIQVYEDAGIEMVRGYIYEPEAKYDYLLCPRVKAQAIGSDVKP